jgi:hypothetical protein
MAFYRLFIFASLSISLMAVMGFVFDPFPSLINVFSVNNYVYEKIIFYASSRYSETSVNFFSFSYFVLFLSLFFYLFSYCRDRRSELESFLALVSLFSLFVYAFFYGIALIPNRVYNFFSVFVSVLFVCNIFVFELRSRLFLIIFASILVVFYYNFSVVPRLWDPVF